MPLNQKIQNLPCQNARHFSEKFHVSRETMTRLEIYKTLLVKWQKSINLIGPSTLAQFWSRHAEDSAQLLSLVPTTAKKWIDLGTGAGFPGLIIAQFWAKKENGATIHLIERDHKKCAFLRQVIRETNVKVQIHETKIEDVGKTDHHIYENVDIMSARALASLSKLFSLSEKFFNRKTIGLFMKGCEWKNDIKESEKIWQCDITPIISQTDQQSRILMCRNPQKKQPHPLMIK